VEVAPIDRTPVNPYPDALATTPDPELTPEQFKFIQDHGSGVLTEKFYSGLVATPARSHCQSEWLMGCCEEIRP
jgi:hypothetical protein